MQVAYIVESDKAKWEPVKLRSGVNISYFPESLFDISCLFRWSLESTKFVHPDQAAEVYADPAVDACLISTPTFTHEDFIVSSLEAGKAVFSEKPIAEAPSGTARCYRKADEVGWDWSRDLHFHFSLVM